MKNNQFKKIIRTEIENECHTFDFVSIAIDRCSHGRMIYIFTLDYKCIGIFDCWFASDYLHLAFTTELEKPMITAQKKELQVKYSNFDKIMQLIKESFNQMDKENP